MIRASANCKKDQNYLDINISNNFPKRSQNVSKILPIYDYTKDVLDNCNVHLDQISTPLVYSPIPTLSNSNKPSEKKQESILSANMSRKIC